MYSVYVCTYVCMYVRMYSVYACMFVYNYVCTVCMYVCMYIGTFVGTYIHIQWNLSITDTLGPVKQVREVKGHPFNASRKLMCFFPAQ